MISGLSILNSGTCTDRLVGGEICRILRKTQLSTGLYFQICEQCVQIELPIKKIINFQISITEVGATV